MPIASSTLVSAVWLVFLMLLSIAYVASQVRRNHYDWWENCIYLPVMLVGRFWWRVNFLNEPPPEIAAGAVLVANHRSSVDPFFVQLSARRRVHWMVAREYCEHLIFGAVLKPLLVIPTNRSGMDTASTKAAIRMTQAGRLVGMFPEGKINQTQRPLLPLRAGAALIAMRSNVPIIPLLIEGSPYCKTVWSPLLMPANVRIRFGTPVHPERFLPENRSPGDEPADSELAPADAMIQAWGRQMLDMAGFSEQQPELVAARRKKKRNDAAAAIQSN